MNATFTGDCLLPGARIAPATVVVRGGVIVQVRLPEPGDPPALSGLIVPGLINAHTHLELSDLGLVAGGEGLPAWVAAQLRKRSPATVGLEVARGAAGALVDAGVAAVSDVCGQASTAQVLLDAGLSGIAQVELLGRDAEREALGVSRAQELGRTLSSSRAVVVERPAPHAPYSTSLALARACLRSVGAAPATVHLAEDPAELTFLRTQTGPWAELLDALGVQWRGRETIPGDPVSWLDAAGGLRSGVLAVHGVCLGPDDLGRLAGAGVSLCLCLRSNLHISRELPDLAACLRSGLTLCLGTDSAASCPDLDVLAELPVLARAVPEVPVARWLELATAGGARALGLPRLGALRVGTAPGIVHLDGSAEDLRLRAPDRRWLVRPAAPARPSEVP